MHTFNIEPINRLAHNGSRLVIRALVHTPIPITGVLFLLLLVFTNAPKAKASQAYAPVLTHENGIFTVFDSQHREHAFQVDGNGILQAASPSAGTMTPLAGKQYQWTNDTGEQYFFTSSGSLLYECTPDEPNTNTDESGADNTQPSTNEEEDDEQCDAANSDAHTFSPSSYQGPHTALDARPQSCKSFFVEYYGTERGMQIESGLKNHPPYKNMRPTIRTFPVVDFMDENSFLVIHSRDLGSRTFNSLKEPNALLKQLLEDGQDIQTRFLDVLHREGSLSAGEMGQSTTITLEQLKPITMQLVIRDAMASPAHWQQITIAREQLMKRHGIRLEIIIIP